MTLPVRIKTMIPGYRARWRSRYACLLREIDALMPKLTFGVDSDPWIALEDGPRLFGYFTEPENQDVFHILKPDLPSSLPMSHFRLVKDCINRYVYPHMRPELKPKNFGIEEMFGFHGQHKDTIEDTFDPELRRRLSESFALKPDDNILDCGAFLGFGDLRVALDIPHGHVYAIEADIDCHRILQRNITENGIENVASVHRAVWNCETELELESDFAQANSLVREIHAGSYTQKVRTITIDGAVAHFGIRKLDLISLTLNGAEVEALQDARHTLQNLRPRIRIAGWYSRDNRKICEITREMLEPFGYDVFVGARGNLMALPKNGITSR